MHQNHAAVRDATHVLDGLLYQDMTGRLRVRRVGAQYGSVTDTYPIAAALARLGRCAGHAKRSRRRA
jgi:hypothetical protein